MDEAAYQTAVERLFYQYWVYGSSSFSRMMSALFGTLRAHNLRMRRELTLAVKAMTQSEELMRAIDPDMPLVQTAAQEAEHLLRQQFTPERITKLLRGELANVVQGFTGAMDALEHPKGLLRGISPAGRVDVESPIEAGRAGPIHARAQDGRTCRATIQNAVLRMVDRTVYMRWFLRIPSDA